MNNTFDYDYIIVGSGFGGSVSALRLSEKGYKVLVIEAGKRFLDKDFPKTTWNLKKFLWAPTLRCFGIMKMTIFKHVFILSGAGVGGGSLVYANTLLVPKDKVWEDPQWKTLNNWPSVMPEFYSTAKKMLGVEKNPFLGAADLLLQKAASSQGFGNTFYKTDVGIYFGKPGEKNADPYFLGKGPERTGCTLCGGCMVGCSHGAKNTLVKNYLFFAEKNGVEILAENYVTDVKPINNHENGDDGYLVTLISSTNFIFKDKKILKTRGVIFSGGVLGTVKLLLNLKENKSLPNLSDVIGDVVRTNSESIIGVRVEDEKINMGSGIAIGSGIHIDENTHIEAVRYSKGSDALSTITTLLPNDKANFPRVLSWAIECFTHPIKALKSLNPIGWANSTLILLVMQTLDGSIKMKLKRSWLNPFKKELATDLADSAPISPFIPKANAFAQALANNTEKGTAVTAFTEIFLNIPTTAHILGGAVMGDSAKNGVINYKNEVFNYKNMYVCDGSMVSANLGVNPSLTITALTEHAMSHIPNKMV
jgi:cholesterol oxidase